MALVKCPECGKEISDRATACPSCGCPIFITQANIEPQQVELTNVSVNVGKKFKKLIILLILLLIAGATAFFCLKKIHTDKRNKEYREKMETVTYLMLLGATEAEEDANLIHDVWYNTIYEKDSSKTDKYTKDSSGEFFDDFNTSLMFLMLDDDFSTSTDSIRSNQEEVQRLMKELVNPPEQYKEAYEALKDYYDAYLEITNLAIDPSGNLSSYTSNFNDADTRIVNTYKTIKMYLD